ncbi:MDR family MFS transporter [Effusibacillus lacus]|uniref:MFS transporter n=1 Tax=Effusibacillus lacus TaxID=1348429 RepID=A0A292YKD3_9BACL|nr:MFS transporter [Effusibacillus lacus]TCS75480.1 putative MFS family arabinose efflux permease [Effusibacillus lacus]GAX88945.1 MFS transporter [Effusibacillus lacus]
MNRIRAFVHQYDTAIWVRVFGTILTTVAGFMLRPFLVLYLYDKLGGSVMMPMVILGLQFSSGVFMNIWGGSLADRYGRKPVMMIALIVEMISMTGFVFADSLWEFAVLAILNGMGMAMFFPAANAQVADVVPEEKRAEVFALLHTALNVGAAAGPLLGLAVFTKNPQLVFALSACAFLIYTVLVWWKVPETLPSEIKANTIRSKAPKLGFREHKNLYLMTFFALPVGMLYTQVESTFPLHLKDHYDNYLSVFTWLMTINGTTVILLQMWIARQTEHFARHKVILASYFLFALVAIGYGVAPAFVLLVLVELLFTLGEMMNGPHIQKAVSLIAPPDMRGRYFSIFTLSWQLSKAVGPVLSGFVFEYLGGLVLFGILAVWLALAGIAQYRLIYRLQSKTGEAANAAQVVPDAAVAD